jgi:zinc protease
MKILLIVILTLQLAQAANFRKNEVKHLQWGDFKTTWLEDNRYPTATFTIYFADGAVQDSIQKAGATQATFDLLFSGTSKMDQAALSSFFDFYGVSFNTNVTHEYSVLTMSALVKDLPVVIDKFCHVIKDAQYPRNQLVPHKKRVVSKLKNLPSHHSSLAERAFRGLMMRGSSYEYPTDGSLASMELIQSDNLVKRWSQLRDEAPKRFYIKGPKEALFVRDQFLNQCGWKTGSSQDFTLKDPISTMAHRVFLVPVPGANQAQIRIGRYLPFQEVKDPDEKMSFAASFLGGGFTAKLIQEVRVKRGLTYSIGSYVSLQAEYGRSGISTFSKNETAAETIRVIRKVLQELSSADSIKEDEIEHMKNYVIGNYPFSFEGSDSFLMQLLLLDHVSEPLEKLYLFPNKIKALTAKDIAWGVKKLFSWDEMVIVVVGDPSLKTSLQNIRPVEIIKPESLL